MIKIDQIFDFLTQKYKNYQQAYENFLKKDLCSCFQRQSNNFGLKIKQLFSNFKMLFKAFIFLVLLTLASNCKLGLGRYKEDNNYCSFDFTYSDSNCSNLLLKSCKWPSCANENKLSSCYFVTKFQSSDWEVCSKQCCPPGTGIPTNRTDINKCLLYQQSKVPINQTQIFLFSFLFLMIGIVLLILVIILIKCLCEQDIISCQKRCCRCITRMIRFSFKKQPEGTLKKQPKQGMEMNQNVERNDDTSCQFNRVSKKSSCNNCIKIKPNILLPCSHTFHAKCIQSQLRNGDCPYRKRKGI